MFTRLVGKQLVKLSVHISAATEVSGFKHYASMDVLQTLMTAMTS